MAVDKGILTEDYGIVKEACANLEALEIDYQGCKILDSM
jgi:hypothetical protein